jgi:hypothetical protein
MLSLALIAATPSLAVADPAAIAGFRTVQLGMPAEAAKAAMAGLGGAVAEVGNSIKVESILRTEVGGVDGGKARLWVDLQGGKVVNISVVRQYDDVADKAACQARFDDKAKEVTGRYGAFDQPGRWQDSQELWVVASRTRARIARDGRALDLLGTWTQGFDPPGAGSPNHVKYCVVSVEISDAAWGRERQASVMQSDGR